MLNLTEPHEPLASKNSRPDFLPPFKLPESNGQKYKYVRTIRHDSPLDVAYTGGLTFQKRCLPAEATYRDNANKHFDYKIPTVLLTEEQASAYYERAKLNSIRIPARDNPEYKKGKNVSEKLPPEKICLADHIILEKVEDFGKRYLQESKWSDALRNPEKAEEDRLDQTEAIKRELLKQQKPLDKMVKGK